MAAYFVVAEALTNVARSAEAEVATVRVERRNGAGDVTNSSDNRRRVLGGPAVSRRAGRELLAVAIEELRLPDSRHEK